METGIFTIPPRTIIEIYQNLPDYARAELIEYIIYLLNTPTDIHQEVLSQIIGSLREVVAESGKANVLVSPIDVFLDQTSHAVKPDVAIVLPGNRGKLVDDLHFHGSPDLIIEVLSEGNVRHDTVKKKTVYQRFGIKEYWIIDPTTKVCCGYALRNGQFALMSENTAVISSPLLGLEIAF